MLFICLLFSLLWLSLTTAQSTNSSSLVSDADRLQAAKNRAALTKLPRYQLFSSGFTLQEAPKRFCGAADNNGRDCNWSVYAESVLLIGALALVAAGLALLFCPIFWALRCCGCCGGLKKTHGWICPGEERTLDDPYSPRSVWVVRCGVIMCAGILFIAFIIAQVGNTGLSNGIELYADTSVQRARDLALDINTTVLKVEALAAKAALVPNLNFNVSALVQPLKAGVQGHRRSLPTSLRASPSPSKQYDTQRSTIQWAAGIVSLILVFIAVIGAICSLPLFAKVLGVLGFLAFAFAWVSFALNYSVAVVIADFCTEVEVVLATGDTTNVAVQLYANCSALVGVAGIKNQIDLQLNRSLTQVCSSIGSVCNMTQPCLDDYSRTCPVVACAAAAQSVQPHDAAALCQLDRQRRSLWMCPAVILQSNHYDDDDGNDDDANVNHWRDVSARLEHVRRRRPFARTVSRTVQSYSDRVFDGLLADAAAHGVAAGRVCDAVHGRGRRRPGQSCQPTAWMRACQGGVSRHKRLYLRERLVERSTRWRAEWASLACFTCLPSFLACLEANDSHETFASDSTSSKRRRSRGSKRCAAVARETRTKCGREENHMHQN
jgi:hypothetical protein